MQLTGKPLERRGKERLRALRDSRAINTIKSLEEVGSVYRGNLSEEERKAIKGETNSRIFAQFAGMMYFLRVSLDKLCTVCCSLIVQFFLEDKTVTVPYFFSQQTQRCKYVVKSGHNKNLGVSFEADRRLAHEGN